jgi:hypothetical protein
MAGGRRKVSFSREEKRQKVKSRSLSLRKDLYSPFYMPKGAGYMSRERVSSCMLNSVRRKTFSMMWVPVLLLAA